MPGAEIPAAPDLAAMAVLSRLAAALARPFSTFDTAQLGIGPIAAEGVRALVADRHFGAPLERAVAAQGHAGLAGLSAARLSAIAGTPEGRLAVLLVSEPAARLEEVALLAAAAALQRQVLEAVDKQARQRLRAALGPNAHQLATQEAPTLYPGLSALAEPGVVPDAIAAGEDAGAARRVLTDFGLRLLVRVVAAAVPELAPAMARRLPGAIRARVGAAVPASDLRQLAKLVNRRMTAWSATIG